MRKALGNIATFQRGLTYNKGDEVPSSSKVVLRSNNIDLDSHSLDLSELKYLREDFIIPEDRKVRKNSIFICMSNGSKQHVGKVAFIDRDMDYAFGGFMGLIVPAKSVSAKYVFYACNSAAYRTFLTQVGNGIGITNLRFSDLERFEIPVPSIDDQQRIVNELDLLTGIIDQKNTQLRDLDALAQTLFIESFGSTQSGWPIKKIKDVCKTTSGGTPSKTHPDYYEGGDIPWLRSGEVNGTAISDSEIRITDAGVKNSSAKWFPAQTVVVAMYGATVGQVGILAKPMTTNQAICGLFPCDCLRPLYLYSWFRSKKEDFVRQATGGAQPNISQNIIRDSSICCPPLDVQDAFVERINAIEHQKTLINKSLKETISLLNGRMDLYFSD